MLANQRCANEIGYKGQEIYDLIKELYPLCRSLTGEGVRRSLEIWGRYLPLETIEVPSGSSALDWTVPPEWNVRDGYIKNASGERIIDFKKNNLHVVGYSEPVSRKMPLNELKKHLHTLIDQPDIIPYRTSYYSRRWGFCLSQNQLDQISEGEYEVCIDSNLDDKGVLNYGECLIKGRLKQEVLIATYICHPSLANDNLSGPCLAAVLGQYLSEMNLKFSYRFLFIPETIGSIVWLSRNEDKVPNIQHGLVATCLGDPGPSTYKKSRRGNALIDRIVEKVLKDSGQPYIIRDFWPQGSDERQFCSPGYDMPVGSLMRTPYGCYPEYHTSADNLEFIAPSYLQDSFEKYMNVIDIIEHNGVYLNTLPKGEPQLGKRGLYGSVGGDNQLDKRIEAQAWVLNLCDGDHSLLDIANRSGINFSFIKDVVPPLVKEGLLKEIEGESV